MGLGKNALYPNHITKAASLGANYTSPSVNTQYLDNVYFSINFTGTPTGTFTVEGSGDAGLTWQTITLVGSPTASGAPDSVGIEINQAPMPLLRVVYTRISGSGVIDIWVTAKALG